MSVDFFNYYKTLGLPDFSPIETVNSSVEYNTRTLLRDYGDDPATIVAVDAIKKAHNILGDPDIKGSYDAALQDHLKLIREELNYYAILNIPEFAELEDGILDGHFYETMRFQPPENYAEALSYIEKAHAVLTDPEKKEVFDAALRAKRSAAEEDQL